ncbi:MAG: quinone-dependent dihydroorotate dehydrogenase [Candidatus Mycalebacterium zealandia]|nr:MAG: quinone-dependent dihydroorotate dehydrogenase [Candidatus Mycalebacterium zealandia]
MSVYKKIVSPILDRFDSETLHSAVVESLHLAAKTSLTLSIAEFVAGGGERFADKRLETEIDGLRLENPLIVGAGWDKKGRAVAGLRAMGFSCAEIGSVTLRPQPGKPKPRLFSLAPGVFLNRLGFNSPGADGVVQNLSNASPLPMPIGISIGLNKDSSEENAPAEHSEVARKLLPFASYFAVNVSSPNTPGLRSLQQKDTLREILKSVVIARGEKKIPVYAKISPETSFAEIDGVIEAVLSSGAAGIIATNTTDSPQIKAKYGARWANESGGISGDDVDYRKLSTERIAYIRSQTKGKITIIGSGGIKDTKTALEKISAGANALQVFTAIRGEGAWVAGNINRGLVRFMEKEGISSLSEIAR